MPCNPERSVIVFGGFRTKTLEGSRAVATLLDALKLDCVEHENLWDGPGDSLRKRFDRAATWLAANADRSLEMHILGHSMGCQLAVKFAHLAHLSAERWRLGQLILTAPDPKYRRVPRDLMEKQAGETPAFDEARDLWGVEGGTGPRFTDTLGLVSGSFTEGCRIVLCRSDAVAEWRQNAETMRSALKSNPAIKWIEAMPGAAVDVHGIRISLEPGEIEPIENADQFHEALWRCSRIASQPRGEGAVQH